ncbi:MAG: hypothetical protein QME74_01405 [Candidatus Edwardsbacteria bacterium]|nr:hypothetical protein [Candidatus Edwardsbacteria bacterium]
MNQSPESLKPQSVNIVLWALVADPVILAVIGCVLKQSGAVNPLANSVTDILFVIFAIASLGLIYASFVFASGKYDPKPAPPALPAKSCVTRLIGLRIVSIGLAAAPAILGFVLHLLSGDDWVLLAFNGGATLAAARHALAFTSAGD